MRLNPPAQLLPDGAVIDVPGMFWKLEGTIGENPGAWGWADKLCLVCGLDLVVKCDRNGYRCLTHRHVAAMLPERLPS